ncbi:hypothetical protein BH23BAC2_BH23BAC2_17340 [soil metagenome]
MKSLCFFISYTESNHIVDLPFIKELNRHFDEVVVITNVPMDNNDYKHMVLPNMGYDFGFLYRAIEATDLSGVSVLGFINNSNILLSDRNLDGFFAWSKSNNSNFIGITDSHEAPRGIKPNKSYHIQSHFLVFKNDAINLLGDFFKEINFKKLFAIKNQKKLRKAIIKQCEIGLSQYMIKKGQGPVSWFKAEKMNSRYNRPVQTNMHVMLWEELIKEDYPLIKKKIVTGDWDNIIPNSSNKYKYI